MTRKNALPVVVEPTTPTPEPEDLSSSQHAPVVRKSKTKPAKPKELLDVEMSQALWNTVSCAIECGGLGGDCWGWESKAGWKAYNDASGKDYQTLMITCRMKDNEQDEILTPWVDMSTDWLYKKMQEFVADTNTPNWIRVQYAGMLATRENPPDEDAVTGDAFLQFAFLGEIRFG